MDKMVNIHEAKTHFSKLLKRVVSGEEIIIAKAGQPIAKVSPYVMRKKRTPGGAEGLTVPESFFDMPDDFMKYFE